MNDQEKEYSETMNKLVYELAHLQETREAIEDAMNNSNSVINLKMRESYLTRALADVEAELAVECSESAGELWQIDRDMVETKARIFGVWDGEKRTTEYGEWVLSLRGRKSVVIDDGGSLLADLMEHFPADRVAKEFIATFNKKNLKSFLDLHPQDKSVARIDEKIGVYVNPSSKQKDV